MGKPRYVEISSSSFHLFRALPSMVNGQALVNQAREKCGLGHAASILNAGLVCLNFRAAFVGLGLGVYPSAHFRKNRSNIFLLCRRRLGKIIKFRRFLLPFAHPVFAKGQVCMRNPFFIQEGRKT